MTKEEIKNIHLEIVSILDSNYKNNILKPIDVATLNILFANFILIYETMLEKNGKG